VHGDRVETSLELLGDITGCEALPDQLEHFLFARRKQFVLHLWHGNVPKHYTSGIKRGGTVGKRPLARAETEPKAMPNSQDESLD
jgi:hypothetical protein